MTTFCILFSNFSFAYLAVNYLNTTFSLKTLHVGGIKLEKKCKNCISGRKQEIILNKLQFLRYSSFRLKNYISGLSWNLNQTARKHNSYIIPM